MRTLQVSLVERVFVVGACLLSLFVVTSVEGQSSEQISPAVGRPTDERRAVEVRDGIEMVRIAGEGRFRYEYGGQPSSDFVFFSPDGTKFVLVLKRGVLKRNETEYMMYLYESAEIFDLPVPRILVSFSSSSNREGIKEVTWLDDNATILFLGERPGETTQLYSVDCATGRVEQLTHESISLTSYSTSLNGSRVAFTLEPSSHEVIDSKVLRDGFSVSTEALSDLIAGQLRSDGEELRVLDRHSDQSQAVPTLGLFPAGQHKLYVSPNGHYLIAMTDAMNIPEEWKLYQDEDMVLGTARRIPENQRTSILRYELLDLVSGGDQALLSSPVSFGNVDVRWSGDSKSVILTGMYLPLTDANPEEKAARRSHTYTIEMQIPERKLTKITDEKVELLGWDRVRSVVRFRRKSSHSNASDCDTAFQRNAEGEWNQILCSGISIPEKRPRIYVQQDANTPARIFAENSSTRRETLLLDPNPQFRKLAFGKVEVFRWNGGASREVTGGLYFPPQFVNGRKYPLVIQTHGFEADQFWIDGPFSTAISAQALAGKGFFVLQVPNGHDSSGYPGEAPIMMKTYEAAIDALEAKGLIDRTRVGLVGFSRDCYYVQYLLTHSEYPIAAAVVADGIDAGYFQYVSFANAAPGFAAEYETLVGDAPFGKGLSVWAERSPSFRLDRVRAPVLLQSIMPFALLSEWEWFSGLTRLGKPVDLLYLPRGTHILEKPNEKMASQQATVDWFLYWIAGQEDSDPRKQEQYARWRKLRKLREQPDTKPKEQPPN